MREFFYGFIFAAFASFVAALTWIAKTKNKIDSNSKKRYENFEKDMEQTERETRSKSLSDNIDDLNRVIKERGDDKPRS